MSTRPAGRWPVSRPVAYVIAAALALAVLYARVPSMRGGLFLLTAAAVTAGFVVLATRRRSH